MGKKINNFAGRNYHRTREEDKISVQRSSSVMSKIRSKHTNFETTFIEWFQSNFNFQFTTHDATLKGKPDLVIAELHICIFLDSDFWHGWQFPRWKHLMKNNFWRQKIENNRKRDMKTTRILRKNSWKIIRIWEHQFYQKQEIVLKKLRNILSTSSPLL